MREGWRLADLGGISDILDSRRKPITKKDRVPGPYPYYGATGVLDYVEGYLFEEQLVLVGEDGAKWGAGESTAFPIDGKCWVNNHAHVLRPNRSIVSDSWLIYYLNHSDLMPFITGLTVPKLNQGKLRGIPIPFPPLPEQERIVAILDEAFAAIATATANAEKNLANARELLGSQLNAVFTQKGDGWVKATIGEVCKLKSGATVPKDIERTHGDIPYVRVSDMSLSGNERRITTSTRFLLESDVKLARVFPVGSTLFPKRGGAIATNKKRLTEVPVCADPNIMGVIPGGDLIPEFVFHYFLRFDLSSIGSGSSIPQINNYDIEPLVIQYPASKTAQLKIVRELECLFEETRRIVSICERRSVLLAELKQSILHKAFTGELTADFNAADVALSKGEV